MKRSDYRTIVSILWLIAASLQQTQNFEIACLALFAANSITALVLTFTDHRKVTP